MLIPTGEVADMRVVLQWPVLFFSEGAQSQFGDKVVHIPVATEADSHGEAGPENVYDFHTSCTRSRRKVTGAARSVER